MDPRKLVRKALIEMAALTDPPDVATLLKILAAVIARSPILIVAPARRLARLPAGFDEIDLAMLDWIAAEGRRIGRAHLPN
jgi:hypothetical protein